MPTHELKTMLVAASRSPKWLAAQSGYSLGTIYGILSPKASHPSKIPRTIAKLSEILRVELNKQNDRLAIRDDLSVVVASDHDQETTIKKINDAAK